MQVDFQRTLRSLTREQGETRAGCMLIGILAALAAGWSVWLFEARVNLYELSTTARIETGQAGHPVDTVLSGRVARVEARLGQTVHTGDVLVELDSMTVAGQIDGATIELAALSSQIGTRESEANLVEQVIAERKSQGDIAMAEAANRRDQAKGTAEHDAYLANQSQTLLRLGATTTNIFLQAQRNASQSQSDANSAALEIDRLRGQSALDQQELKVRLADLRDRTAELRAAIARRTAELETLRLKLEDHRVRAPADGIVGELADIRVGSVVQGGARLATIVPNGSFHVVAEFAPAGAIGRVATGQTAHIRLNGFPWQQYGSLVATVADVASEVRDGTIRVELALSPGAPSAIPLQHGQPGEVEIQVGSASPFDLIVRNTTTMLTHSDDPTDAPGALTRTARNGNPS